MDKLYIDNICKNCIYYTEYNDSCVFGEKHKNPSICSLYSSNGEKTLVFFCHEYKEKELSSSKK